jgi:hypothetical protein
VPVPRAAGAGDLPGGDFQGGEQRGGAVPDVVMGLLLRDPGPEREDRAVRSRAWTCDFSSTQSTIALSGGLRQRPTTSRSLLSSSGSAENVNVCVRQGCSPYSRHTSATLTSETPSSAPSSRDDQCVTPSRPGGGSSVARTIATSSVVRGRPGLGRSSSPPRPPAAYRRFHAITVGFDAPVRRMISLVPSPSAASSTIRARCARPARIDGNRSHDASTSRSPGGTPTPAVSAISHSPGPVTHGQAISLTGH